MRYVLDHTIVFLKDTVGADLWASCGADAEVILAHPNKWGAHEQNFLLQAAIEAELISKERAKTGLFFVEEAEASARY
jgi:hypothetical protein